MTLANIMIIVLGTSDNVITKYFKSFKHAEPFESSSKLMASKEMFPQAFYSVVNSVAEDNVYKTLMQINSE